MEKLLTLDEFRAQARKDANLSGTVMRLAAAQSTPVDGKSRTRTFCFSDGAVDRAGDKINVDGWKTADFMNNPVALWAHDSWSPPVGKASNVGPRGGRFMGDIEFAPPETYDFADTVFRLVEGGYVNAVSVGFRPVKWSFSAEKDRPFGIDFEEQELLEISLCPVPCNAGALIEARAKGIDTRPLMEWAGRVLDEGNAVMMPRETLEQIFKDARTPHTARAKYRELIERKDMDWKCSAARDLPINEDSSWDGAEAKKSIFEACGFDGDSPDTERAAKHFLAHDASAPALKGSYKLPFARIVDGKSEAVANGLHNCAARLPDTDISDACKTSAQDVIDHYKARMGEKAWTKAAGEDTNADGGEIVPAASCGKAKDEECLFKDPANCMTHAPETKTFKSGRQISAKNRAKLQEALDHHEAAAKCIRDVMESDAAPADIEPDGDDAGGDTHVVEDNLTPEQRRLKEARALKASLTA